MLDPQKKEALRARLREYGAVVVTLSGGIDSTLLAKVAHDELGARALAVTGVSPSLAESELADARTIARQIGIAHLEAPTHEMERSGYISNPEDRCYHCKSELFEVARQIAREKGFRVVIEGTHVEDLRGHRPGFRAAEESGVHSPFVEVGFTKEDIRDFARELGLSNWDKPALACLSSRIPTGTAITRERLRTVESAERVLREAGARRFRARFHGDTLRIELGTEDFSLIGERLFRERVVTGCRNLGFRHVTVDLTPYGAPRPIQETGVEGDTEEMAAAIRALGARSVDCRRQDSILRIRLSAEDESLFSDLGFLTGIREHAPFLKFRNVALDLSLRAGEYVPLKVGAAFG